MFEWFLQISKEYFKLFFREMDVHQDHNIVQLTIQMEHANNVYMVHTLMKEVVIHVYQQMQE